MLQIHSIEHIETRLSEIEVILEQGYDTDDGGLLVQRLSLIGAYMAESGKLKGDAEYHMRAKKNNEIMDQIIKLLPAFISKTVQNEFVESLAKYECRINTWADRVNRSCTHQCENLRTQISYLKSLPR